MTPAPPTTITALVDEVRALRPDLRIERAFLELCQAVASRRSWTGWCGPGYDEIVVVPLLLTEALPRQGRRAQRRRRGRPPGTRACRSGRRRSSAWSRAFLEVLDLRLREALAKARVRELDALVLAAAGSSDPLANQAVARLARVWGTHHKLPVTAAFASAAPPATGEAVRAFRARGPPPHRRRLAVPGARASCPTGPRSSPSRPAPCRLRAARRPPRARPHHPGPLRRRRRRARPRLTHADPAHLAARPRRQSRQLTTGRRPAGSAAARAAGPGRR